MDWKKRTAALAAALLLALAPISALAETWSTEDFSFQAPENMREFTLDTPLDDPGWALAGVADPESKLEEYQDMGTVVNFLSEDGDTSILVMKKESDYSSSVYNLSALDEEGRQDVLDYLTQDETGTVEVEGSLSQPGGDLWFYRVSYQVDTGETIAYELVYGTIINGYAVNFDVFRQGEPISQEQEDLLADMAASFTVPQVLEKPEATLTTKDIAVTVSLLVLLAAAILVPTVYFPLRNKRDKRRKAQLAERLSQFHKEHGDGETIEGSIRFANSTECTKEAIHTFSIYQAYVKNLPALLVGTVLCLFMLGMAFLLDTEWWLKLLALGITIYYGYKIGTAGQAIEKVQRKVFGRGVSDVARLAFYDEAFRVSGIQSASVFPYFQITAVRRHSHYLYLYYGPENAYLVDQYGFTLGDWESFLKFIAEKTGKKL